MRRRKTQQVIGVISDTHGLIRPEALRAFEGVELILHGGDIGGPDVLGRLRSIAPVIAVRGNNDTGAWARELPDSQMVHAGEIRIYLLHDRKQIKVYPPERQVHIVISGHSHRPSIERREGILFLNPGSAGPRRFKLPISVARIIIRGPKVQAELIELPAAHRNLQMSFTAPPQVE